MLRNREWGSKMQLFLCLGTFTQSAHVTHFAHSPIHEEMGDCVDVALLVNEKVTVRGKFARAHCGPGKREKSRRKWSECRAKKTYILQSNHGETPSATSESPRLAIPPHTHAVISRWIRHSLSWLLHCGAWALSIVISLCIHGTDIFSPRAGSPEINILGSPICTLYRALPSLVLHSALRPLFSEQSRKNSHITHWGYTVCISHTQIRTCVDV